MNLKNIQKYHVKQRDSSDCGPACVKSVLRYFQSDATIEAIRNLSGTNTQGTSLLGLYQASAQLGLNAEGYESDVEHLKACADIGILHVSKENNQAHFLVSYGFDSGTGKFLIGDPAEASVRLISPQDLSSIWLSKTLLLLKPNEALLKKENLGSKKVRWFRTLILEDKNLLLFFFSFGVLIAILSISTAIFSQRLLDKIIPSKDFSKVFVALFVLFFLFSIKALFAYTRSLMLVRQGRDFNIRTLDFFFSRLLNLPKSFFLNRKVGDLIARMNDTQRIQRTISTLISQASIDILVGLVAIFAIFFTIGKSAW